MNKVFRHGLSKIPSAIAQFLIKEFYYRGRPLTNAERERGVNRTGKPGRQQIFAINNFNYILKPKNLKESILKD